MARIFVVEDDASLREELMRLLELQGHTALTGTAFDRIVDVGLAAAPDCVILDLKLPGTDGGRSVDLTRNELKILHMLMANHDTIISRQELMVELWQSDAFIDDNTLTVNINRLRKSLASIGVPDDFLVTRRGQGYVV